MDKWEYCGRELAQQWGVWVHQLKYRNEQEMMDKVLQSLKEKESIGIQRCWRSKGRMIDMALKERKELYKVELRLMQENWVKVNVEWMAVQQGHV